MGTQLPLPQRGTAPNFRPMSVVAKLLDGLIRYRYMPLGMEVGSAQSTLYSMGPRYPQKKGHTHPHPIFGPCLLWPNGWMDQDATWYGSRRRQNWNILLDGVPALGERDTAGPSFGPCLLWPRSPISATVELFLVKIKIRSCTSYTSSPRQDLGHVEEKLFIAAHKQTYQSTW